MTALNSEGLEKAVAQAIFDPGATEGYKGDRTLTEWQVQAVMRAITSHTPAIPPVDGMEVLALDLAKRIEREFYHDQAGGAVQTRAKVQVIIAEALSQASSVIAGLTAERDAAWSARNENAKLKGQRDAALARISSLEEENKRLREALELVEDVAENYMNFDPDSRFGLAIASARQTLEDHNG